MHKALSLISGGLDSMLSTKLILLQDIEVIGINFFTGFSGDHDYHFKRSENGRYAARKIADRLGIKLHVVDVIDDFKSVLLCPRYGYGANLNPCLDCKLFMITLAKKWMEKNGCDFLITGEVMGQRPMSQRKDTLPLATKITDDLIVRPLSAKLLEPTLPERESWIKRELLGDIGGRGREKQIKLAENFGFKELPQPGGGCSLTDTSFCRRLQDLLDHRLNQNYSRDDILLLHVGRHLRIKPNLKIIVGRDEVENSFIEKFLGKNILLQTASYPGALVLVDGDVSQNDISLIAQISVYFSKGRGEKNVKVLLRDLQGEGRIIDADSLTEVDFLKRWYLWALLNKSS